MNNQNVNMEIARVAKQVSKFVLRYKGDDLMNRVQSILVIELEGYETKELASRLVFRAMSKEAYEILFPQMGMDQEGNYTYDQSKWA